MTLQDFAYTGNPITESVSSSGQVTRTIVPDQAASVTMKADPYNGIAKFRYDRVLCNFYRDEREELFADLYFDHLVATKVKINNTTYVFSRGVAQVGEDEETPIYKALTKMPYLRRHHNYELGVVLATNGSLNIIIEETEEQTGEYQLTGKNIVYVDLQQFEGDGKLIISKGATAMTYTKMVDTDTPRHPFYVRWINNQGGYDYFMFGKNYNRGYSLTENDYYEPAEARGVMTTITKEGTNVVEVETEIIDRQTLEAVAMLQYSPDIRWYNENTEEWVRIQVNSADINILEEQPTGQITMSFILPKPQMNR